MLSHRCSVDFYFAPKTIVDGFDTNRLRFKPVHQVSYNYNCLAHNYDVNHMIILVILIKCYCYSIGNAF